MSLRRFTFIVYDTPKPLSRPRVNTKTGQFYLPQKDQDVRFNIRKAWLELGEDLLTGPLRLTCTAFLPMPKSIAKKRRATALPSKRPDLDNYIKQVEDALQKYAFLDDAQIVTIIARKRYTEGAPCWQITLDEIENQDDVIITFNARDFQETGEYDRKIIYG